MSRTLLSDEAARRSLQRGVNSLADVSKVTIGPLGRNVAIGNIEVGPDGGAFKKVQGGGLTVTNDGLLIARQTAPADPVENLGVRLVTEAAVAALAAKDREVGGLMVETMAKGGIVTVEKGHALGLHLEFGEGVKPAGGCVSPETGGMEPVRANMSEGMTLTIDVSSIC
ncbi:hypothetical protein [Streptomyces cucumeris]|uniref:hypothetical protein n=1 Tax=Streptomyces cucumeris TaxID=2962890 RepID=UPI003D7198A1